MQDLMDGFFPSELQERFPNGVLFLVRTEFMQFSSLISPLGLPLLIFRIMDLTNLLPYTRVHKFGLII